MAIAGKWETFVTEKPETRSALSIGMEWSSRITTIGLEFALPAFLGFGLDRWWGTSPWMTLGGAFLGLTIGMLHVFRLASQLSGGPGRRNGRGQAGPREGRGGPA
jgi:ATP synthase protein I